MQAARIEFAERGLHGSNLTDILKRANVSPGAFYHHFADKQDLFLAVSMSFAGRIRDMIRATRKLLLQSSNSGELERFVADLYRNALALANENREFFLIFMREIQNDNPRVRAFFLQDQENFRIELRAMMDDLVARGMIEPIDTKWAACLVSTAALSAVLEQLEYPADPEVWSEAMARFTLGAIRALDRTLPPPPSRVDVTAS